MFPLLLVVLPVLPVFLTLPDLFEPPLLLFLLPPLPGFLVRCACFTSRRRQSSDC